MKSRIMFLLCLALIVFPIHSFAKEKTSNQEWHQISDLSDSIFQNVDDHQYEAALKDLNVFNKDWSNYSDTVLGVSEDKDYVIETTMNNLMDILDKEVSAKEKRQKAIEFRLAIDALASNQNPLWKGLKSQLLTPLKKMDSAVKQGNDTEFQTGLNQFLDVYEMIYPAMLIDVNQHELNSVNNEVNEITNDRMTLLQNKSAAHHLDQIYSDLDRLFSSSQGIFQKQLYAVIFIIGGITIITLLYVSWRKYKGQVRHEGN
ncbi:sporulation protein YpjB [Scopulibacillus daqui]|uniref:Sporulation protein YpjB n=1 Tax=Scopulibacillus daqui TaxID=1469162 RepID=A0ABS2Q0R3_9BACL|nr:sporulation protein YpjB [Scopulibacillus daqui]MBM7645274.1 sporulation protein YpjB [Scopulibacillus daqui]